MTQHTQRSLVGQLCVLVALGGMIWSSVATSQAFSEPQLEITCSWGSSDVTVSSSVFAAIGESVVLQLGRKTGVLSVSVWPTSDREFQLQLAVLPSDFDAASTLAANAVSRAVDGKFGEPIELTEAEAVALGMERGVSVSVADLRNVRAVLE